jgi:hypothetical protein
VLVGLTLAAAIVVATLALSQNLRWTGERERAPFAGDFLHEWTGAYIVRSGDVGRLYDFAYADRLQHDPALVGFRLRTDGFLPLVYPPVYYRALGPLAALPYRAAAWTWIGITLAAFAATVLVLGIAVGPWGALDRLLPRPDEAMRDVRRLAILVVLPGAVAFLPFAENLVGGQKATLLLLVSTITWLLLQQGHELEAGLVFGLMAVKPQLGFVLPLALLAKGRWRFALGVATTTAILVVGSLAMGLDVARAYAELVQTLPERIRLAPGQPHRIHGAYGFFTILGGGPTLAVRLATVAVDGVVLALLARLLRGSLDPTSPRFAVQYAGMILASVLLAPNVLTYDLTILLLPIFLLGTLLVRGAVRSDRRRAVLWSLVALYVIPCVSPSIAARTSIQLTLPVLVGVLALVSRRDGILAARPADEPMRPERGPALGRVTDAAHSPH